MSGRTSSDSTTRASTRWKSRAPVASPSRTRSGSTGPTASGRSTPWWPTATASASRHSMSRARTRCAALQCRSRRPAAADDPGRVRPAPALLLMRPALWRRLLAEFCGTAFLVAVVVGSGIAAQKLSPGDTGLQLFENAAATAAGLVALILAFGPVSGAHFNPVVSGADSFFGGLRRRELPAYVVAQVAGAIAGAVIANLMFGLDAVD